MFGGSGIVTLDQYNPNAFYDPTTTDVARTAGAAIVAGLMPNPYDVGFDDQFHRYSVVIPDYYMDLNTTRDGGQNFRFRIRSVDVAALISDQPKGAGKGKQGNPNDDDDAFLVDNVAVMPSSIRPDLEAQSINVL